MPRNYLNWKFPGDCVQVLRHNRNRGMLYITAGGHACMPKRASEIFRGFLQTPDFRFFYLCARIGFLYHILIIPGTVQIQNTQIPLQGCPGSKNPMVLPESVHTADATTDSPPGRLPWRFNYRSVGIKPVICPAVLYLLRGSAGRRTLMDFAPVSYVWNSTPRRSPGAGALVH